jgi:hypothetical protein
MAIAAGTIVSTGLVVASGTNAFAANPTCSPQSGVGPGLGSHHDPLQSPLRICGEGQGTVTVPASGDVSVTVQIFQTYPGHGPVDTLFLPGSEIQIPYYSTSGGSAANPSFADIPLSFVELQDKAGNNPTTFSVTLTGLTPGVDAIGNVTTTNQLWLSGSVLDSTGQEIFLHYKVSINDGAGASGTGTLTGEDWVLPGAAPVQNL